MTLQRNHKLRLISKLNKISNTLLGWNDSEFKRQTEKSKTTQEAKQDNPELQFYMRLELFKEGSI